MNVFLFVYYNNINYDLIDVNPVFLTCLIQIEIYLCGINIT